MVMLRGLKCIRYQWHSNNTSSIPQASCVIHDYCYRDRGWFSRRSKEDCDSEFASNMFAQCDGQTSCQAAALACTEAVATNEAQKAFDDADSC